MANYKYKLNKMYGRFDMVNADGGGDLTEVWDAINDIKNWVDFPPPPDPALATLKRVNIAADNMPGGLYQPTYPSTDAAIGRMYFPTDRLYSHTFQIESHDDHGRFLDFDLTALPLETRQQEAGQHPMPEGLFSFTKSAPDANNVVTVTMATTSLDLLAQYVPTVQRFEGGSITALGWDFCIKVNQHETERTLFIGALGGGVVLAASANPPDATTYEANLVLTAYNGTTTFNFNADGTPANGFGFTFNYHMDCSASVYYMTPKIVNANDSFILDSISTMAEVTGLPHSYYRCNCRMTPNTTGAERQLQLTLLDIFRQQSVVITLIQAAQ